MFFFEVCIFVEGARVIRKYNFLMKKKKFNFLLFLCESILGIFSCTILYVKKKVLDFVANF
jgi:hypothetical protein